MANNKREAAGWGFRLVAVTLTLAVMVGVFAYTFSQTGNEPKSIMRAAIPFGCAVIISYALGSIGRLSHKRWQIYLAVLVLVAVVVCWQIF